MFDNNSSYRITESEKLMKRMHVIISGRVQGVFFRAATRRAAADFNLTGWVRNMDNGRVEAVLEGEDVEVDKMIAWCKARPLPESKRLLQPKNTTPAVFRTSALSICKLSSFHTNFEYNKR